MTTTGQLTAITVNNLAQHTGWGAYLLEATTVASEPDTVSPMGLRLFLRNAIKAGGTASLGRNGTITMEYETSPGVTLRAQATPLRTIPGDVCRLCLRFKHEHDEREPTEAGECDGVYFHRPHKGDHSVCTRCSQYRMEHRPELDTVACKAFTTDYEPEPDWDEEEPDDIG